jgi:hypothetical protein
VFVSTAAQSSKRSGKFMNNKDGKAREFWLLPYNGKDRTRDQISISEVKGDGWIHSIEISALRELEEENKKLLDVGYQLVKELNLERSRLNYLTDFLKGLGDVMNCTKDEDCEHCIVIAMIADQDEARK